MNRGWFGDQHMYFLMCSVKKSYWVCNNKIVDTF